MTLITSVLPAPTTWMLTTPTISPTLAAGNTSNSNPANSTETASSNGSTSYASRHALAIGVGVGGSIGATALGLLAFYLFYRRRQKSMELIEVYQGPLPSVNPAFRDDDSPMDERRVEGLPRGRSVRRSHLESLRSPVEPMFLPPIQSPLPLSPIFTPSTPFDRVGRAF
jgi:hypothetical protein